MQFVQTPTLNSAAETTGVVRSSRQNLCWSDTRARPARQEQRPSGRRRIITHERQMMSEEIMKIKREKNKWQTHAKKSNHTWSRVEEQTSQQFFESVQKTRRWLNPGRYFIRGQLQNLTNGDVSNNMLCKKARVVVSYVFIVVKTHIRPFAVSRVLSQLARIWTFSWSHALRKTRFTNNTAHFTLTVKWRADYALSGQLAHIFYTFKPCHMAICI